MRIKACGFTLSELLIALVILGLIATFTIPKVLQSQSGSQYKSVAKEAAGFVSDAYTVYKQQNGMGAGIAVNHLTPYLNYVRVNTTALMDRAQGSSNYDCSGYGCLTLHNGATLIYSIGETFGSTASTAAIWFGVDPDGKITNGGTGDTSANAPGKTVIFFLYLDGRLRTFASVEPNTQTNWNTYGPAPSQDPPWFSWN